MKSLMLTDQILQTAALVVPVYLLILLVSWYFDREDGIGNVIGFTALAVIGLVAGALMCAAFVGALYLLSLAIEVSSALGWIVGIVMAWMFFCLLVEQGNDPNWNWMKRVAWAGVLLLGFSAVMGVLVILGRIWGWS